jgi:hypothetical protein
MEKQPLVWADRHGRNWVPRRLARWMATTAADPAPSRRERLVRPSLISYAAGRGGRMARGTVSHARGEGRGAWGAESGVVRRLSRWAMREARRGGSASGTDVSTDTGSARLGRIMELFETVTISSRGFATLLLRSRASPFWYSGAHSHATLGQLFSRALLGKVKVKIVPAVSTAPLGRPSLVLHAHAKMGGLLALPLRLRLGGGGDGDTVAQLPGLVVSSEAATVRGILKR